MIRKGLIYSLLGCIIGAIATYYIINQSFIKPYQEENSVIIIEKIKKVTKLVAVEVSFSELLDYGESYKYDFLELFSKKIILRINAKTSLGYDFENLNITFDSVNKRMILNEWPHPEILSIDHDVDYYDISQGTFNAFSAQELTQINTKAKEYIRTKISHTNAYQAALEQRKDYIDLMDMALKSVGWSLLIKGPDTKVQLQ